MLGLRMYGGPSVDLLRSALETDVFVHFSVRLMRADKRELGGSFRLHGIVDKLGKPNEDGYRFLSLLPRDQFDVARPELTGTYSPKWYKGRVWVDESQTDNVPLLWLGLPDRIINPLQKANCSTLHSLRHMEMQQMAFHFAHYETDRLALPMTNEAAEAAADKAVRVVQHLQLLGVDYQCRIRTENEIYASF